MRDISYFQEYERRRANTPITQNYSTGTATVVTTGSRLTTGIGVTISTNAFTSAFTAASSGASYRAAAYPRYRLEKTYTFIGEVRVLQDANLQIQDCPEREWVDVEQGFNYYT
jgi:hypothetical protein